MDYGIILVTASNSLTGESYPTSTLSCVTDTDCNDHRLDPRAPPDDPGAAMTDQYLVADAYLVGMANQLSEIATILNKPDESKRYKTEHSKLRAAFQTEYVSPSGRLSSDTQTAYCLAYQFNLLDENQLKGASERLVRLVTRGDFRIATGFAGTPGILHALRKAGHLQVAYRMLQEKGCPSWLYPVTMDATTVWERWDSLLPDGSINVSHPPKRSDI
jgi:alpha-L-rhamnosidase